jgi:DNA-binding SARP family transcriptional activator
VEIEGEGVERDLPGRQGRLLFAYLVLNRHRPVRRDELVEALWSEEGPPPSGDALLAPPLSRLRKALGPERVQGRSELALALPADAWVDWEVTAALLAEAAAAEARGDAERAATAARELLALADLGLLPGLEATWIDERRAELGDRRVQALELLARAGTRLGGAELPAAERAARAAVEAAPFRESAHAALMAALRAAGNVAEALRAYEELRTLLREELGTTPSPALVAQHEQLLGPGAPAEPVPAEPVPAVRPALPDRLAQAVATPLAGRREVLERLEAELAAARAGETRLVLLTGDGGIGKTRSVAEAARAATGFTVLYGRCDEDELFPFGPWIELLGTHLDAAGPAELADAVGPFGPDLARLLPRLRGRLPGLPEPAPLDPGTERRHLFDAVIAVVRRLAARGPVLLVLDDLHWADRSSLLLARQLVRAAPLGPVALLGTFRDAELGERHPLLEVLADLEREQPVPRLALGGLSREESAELLPELDAEQLRRLHVETGGNPLFLRQLARHLEEESGERLPRGIRELIGRRVAKLPDEAGRLLRVAALIGRDFELDLLERVVDLDEDALLDLLDLAVGAGLLSEVPSTPGRYSFTHALLRTTLEDELTATRRARLHRRIGEAIEQKFRDRPEPHLSELARHFAAAGPEEVDRAVSYALRAADQAGARLAFEEAVELLRGALAARERDQPVDDGERARLLLALTDAVWRAGRWDEVQPTARRAADAARAAAAPTLLARAALAHAGGTFERYGTFDEASADLLDAALDALPAGDSALRSALLARLSAVLYASPDSEIRGADLADEAIALARRLGDGRALATALAAALFAHWRPGEAGLRLAHADELLGLLDESADPVALAECHLWRGSALLELCRRDEAEAAFAAHAELAMRLQQGSLMIHATAIRAMLTLLDGRWEEAERIAGQMLEAGDAAMAAGSAPSPLHLQFYGVEMIALRNEQLRLSEIGPYFERLVREIGALPGWRTPVAWAMAQAGLRDAALAELAQLRAGEYAALPYDANYDAALAILSHTAAELGDAELAAEVEPRLRRLEGTWVVLGPGAATLGPVSYCLGVLRLVLDDAAGAEADLRRALEESRAMRARPYEGHAAAALARAVEARDPAQAAELRELAGAIADELTMPRLARDLAAAADARS